MRGKRLTNQESIIMHENEIMQTEERLSDYIEETVRPFIGLDISKSPDQSVITYISSSRKVLNCQECLYYESCDKRDAEGLVYCFRKPRCVCVKCKLKYECNDAKDGVILCKNYVPIQEISKIDYMR